MTRELLIQALEALVGYRREMRLMLGDEESQPCDAEQAIRAHLAEPQAEPVATLHDDGYWTWKQGRPPHVSNYAGWRMDVYAAPQSQPERKPMTESEMLEGRERTFSVDNPYCPCDRKTFMKVARYVEAFHGIFGGKP